MVVQDGVLRTVDFDPIFDDILDIRARVTVHTKGDTRERRQAAVLPETGEEEDRGLLLCGRQRGGKRAI